MQWSRDVGRDLRGARARARALRKEKLCLKNLPLPILGFRHEAILR